MMENRKLTFVVPAYNEEESIFELYDQISKNVDICIENNLVTSFEVLFVDDGSKDKTREKIKELAAAHDNVRYIFFRKNFGKSIALQTAFRNVDGDLIITMDCDLQDDPIEIRRFVEKIDEGYDMVVGWKKNRLDSAEKRLPSKLFNKVTAAMSGIQLHDFDCGYKAMRREVVDSLNLYGQLHRYIPVLAYRMGFRITEIDVHHNKRKYGKSKYGVERYLQGLFDFISVTFLSKFYDRPMYLFGRFGLFTGLIGLIICFYMVFVWFCHVPIGTRPLLQLGILLIVLSANFFSIGFLGNMLLDSTVSRNYNERHVKEKNIED